MNPNLHSQQVPVEVLDQAKKMVDELMKLLTPYLISLTDADRQALPKMGSKTLSFVTKSQEYATQNPSLLPSFVSKAEFDTDVADAVNLTGFKAQVDQLASLIDDTVMIAGSEAYTAALAFYNNAKLASKQNVPGAKVIADELAARFAMRAKKLETT
jgi:hypothetical protein